MSRPEESALGDFVGGLIAATAALLAGLGGFEALATRRLDLLFFRNIVLDDVLGSWRYVARFGASASFAVLAGFAYYLMLRRYDWPLPGRIAGALGGGGAAGAIIVVALALILSGVAVVALVYGLFFGPGDR